MYARNGIWCDYASKPEAMHSIMLVVHSRDAHLERIAVLRLLCFFSPSEGRRKRNMQLALNAIYVVRERGRLERQLACKIVLTHGTFHGVCCLIVDDFASPRGSLRAIDDDLCVGRGRGGSMLPHFFLLRDLSL